jgi:hypothetical protein
MGSTFDSHPYTIGSLLGENERRSVELPRFQRGFSWESTQVSNFWEDLIGFKKQYDAKPISASYFLGPIVLQDQTQEIILLDGQQRLATATILLSCIRDLARTLGRKGNDLARDIQTTCIQKGDDDPPRYALKLGELDDIYFAQTIKNDPPQPTKAALRSHRLIEGAYKDLYARLKEYIGNASDDEAVRSLKTLRDCVSKGMKMAGITVQSEDDAFDIFETLNDRGLRLSVPDLLLNMLMKRASDNANRDLVRTRWNSMLQQMGRRDISRFLRHMWLSKYGDLKARGLFSEMKEHLINKSIDSLTFADGCAQECDCYISLLDIGHDIPKKAKEPVEGLVKNLNATSCLPLLLSGLVSLNENDFAKLASLVVALFVRHSLLANLNPANLESAFYEAARELRGKKATNEKSSKCLYAAKEILSKVNPSDATVQENAKELELNKRQATWLLSNLAKAMQSKTKEIGFDVITLEHIFPINAGSDWPNRKDLEPYVWHIGNLTILGETLNNNAKSKGYSIKQKNYYSKSEISMTEELLHYQQWTPKELHERGISLVREVTKVWPGP